LHLHHSGKENVSFPFCHEAPPCSDARVSASGDLHCTDTPDGGPTDQLCLRAVRAPAKRPQNMPITPHESIAGHWFSYNRHERHCGGVVAQDLRDRPPQALLARSWPAHAVPRSSPLLAPRPRSTWVSLRTARQVVKPNLEELRARPAHKDHLSGEGEPMHAHTHKHLRTEMPAVGSHAICPTLRLPPRPVLPL